MKDIEKASRSKAQTLQNYRERHAELYDIFYKDKPYPQESAFIHSCLSMFGKTGGKDILELACGTGSHAFELESLGYNVHGIDNSEAMLAQAKRKARRKKSAVQFEVADMTALNFKWRFDGVISLFDSIGYVRTNENILRVMENVETLLKPGGVFIFEFWHAPAMLRHFDKTRTRHWATPEGKILRISETSLSPAHSLAEVKFQIYELNHNGTFRSFEETQVNRYFSVGEMRLFVEAAGLRPVKWFAGYQHDERITDETWHVVAVATKP